MVAVVAGDVLGRFGGLGVLMDCALASALALSSDNFGAGEDAMRRFGQLLMALGAAIGVCVGLAMLTHLGLSGASWLVNVALAKLGLVSALGLMGGGAVGIRMADRNDARKLGSGSGSQT